MAEKQLNPQRIGLAPAKRNHWVVDVEFGTPIDAIMDPQYFAHIAMKLTPWDRIEAREESGAWMADLLVRSVGQVTVELEQLAVYDFEKKGAKIGAPYQGDGETDCVGEWGGPYHKWRIRRGLEVLQTGLQSRAQANLWIADYMKARAA